MAYCEHVGVKRQPEFPPNKKVCAGENVRRQTRTAKIRMCWNTFTVSVFEQLRAVQRGEKILFHSGKIFLRNRVARDQNEFHRRREFVLMLPETFAEQPPGAAAGHRAADFFAGDDAEFRRLTIGKLAPVGDEAAQNEPFSPLPDAREIAALCEPRGAAQAQALRRGVHKIKPA